jgi:hypothetical protein
MMSRAALALLGRVACKHSVSLESLEGASRHRAGAWVLLDSRLCFFSRVIWVVSNCTGKSINPTRTVIGNYCRSRCLTGY